MRFFLLSIFISSGLMAQLPKDISLMQNQPIISADLNENVNYINNILSPYSFYNYNLDWSNANNKEYIVKNNFNNLFKSLDDLQVNNYNIILSQEIKASEINDSFLYLENSALDIVPQSCLEILERQPNLINQDGTYLIDSDGYEGPNLPYLVYCDMTTDGGGWTNIAPIMGNFTNQLTANVMVNPDAINSSANLSSIGLNSNATSDSLVNGSLASRGSSGSCTRSYYGLFIDPNLLTRYGATRVKLDAKSYAGGQLECGGILNTIKDGYSDLQKYNNFNNNQLSKCGTYSSNSYHSYTNSNYFHFSFIPGGTYIASLVARCRSGNAYVQIRSIMVR